MFLGIKDVITFESKTYQRRSRVSLMGDCRVIIGGGSEELIFSSFDNGWWFAEYKCM